MSAGRASVVFNADTGQYVRSLCEMDEATAKTADGVADAKNRILAYHNEAMKALEAQGRGFDAYAQQSAKTSKMLADVDDTNFKKRAEAADRLTESLQRQLVELQNLRTVSPVVSGGGLADIPNRLKTSTVLRVSEGTTSIRGAEAFISAVPALAALSNLVFPIAAATGFFAIIAEGVTKGYEGFEKFRQAVEGTRNAFQDAHDSAAVRIDDLELENQKIQDQIDKISGRPNNGLASSLLEAKKAADQLLVSLQDDRKELQSLLKQNDTGFWSSIASFTGFGPSSPGKQDDQLLSDQSQLWSATRRATLEFDASTSGKVDKGSAERASQTYVEAIHDIYQRQIDAYKKESARLKRQQELSEKEAEASASAPSATALGGYGGVGPYTPVIDNSLKIQNVEGRAKQLEDAQRIALLQARVRASSISLGVATQARENGEIGNKLDDQRLKAMEAQVTEWRLQGLASAKAIYDYWERQKDAFAQGSAQFNQIVEKQLAIRQAAADKNKQVRELYKAGKFTEANDLLTGHVEPEPDEGASIYEASQRAIEEWRKTDARKEEILGRTRGMASLRAAVDSSNNSLSMTDLLARTGRISQHDAATQMATIHSQEYAERLATLESDLAREQRNDPNSPATVEAAAALAKAKTDRVVQIQEDAARVAGTAWKGALTNAYDEWYQHAKDTAAQISQLFDQSINGLNENLENLMSGQYKRGDLRKFGSGVLKTASGDLLQHGEAALFGAFDAKPKADGSQSNPLYVILAGAHPSAAGLASLFDDSSPRGAIGKSGGRGGIFGAFAALFHPHGINGGAGNSTGFDSGSSSSSAYGSKPSAWTTALGYIGQALGITGAAVHAGGPGFASPGDGSMSWRDQDPFSPDGGFALGGGVDTSGIYDVGEMGRERVFLPKGSYVQPHNKMGGGNVYYSVQVANGVTPEETDMRVRAALAAYHPHVVRASVEAMKDDERRRPRR